MIERPKVTRITGRTPPPVTRCNRRRCRAKPAMNASGRINSIARKGLIRRRSTSSANDASTTSPWAMLTAMTPTESERPSANSVEAAEQDALDELVGRLPIVVSQIVLRDDVVMSPAGGRRVRPVPPAGREGRRCKDRLMSCSTTSIPIRRARICGNG
jgi:hypothetical protein